MLPSKTTLFATALAVVHSFSHASATGVASAEESTITPAPTPTADLEARDGVAGGPGTPILSTLRYDFTALPEQVYPFAVLRGPQFGFNQCNSTTEGPNSNCQTLIFNNASDFCLWGSPEANGSVGDDEAKVVAYCTKPGHGTRVFPAGALHGLQWMVTPGYIQAVGFIDNSALGLSNSDSGGELDPHGADLQGNPLGGVVYSNFLAPGENPQQVFNWNTFVGSGTFCFKACFNNVTSPDYCENRYDLIGCEYNMPNAAQNGSFVVCEGDVQTPVGTYTSGGQTLTWSMPDPLNTPPPYQPVVPSSSNCVTYSSEQLFAGLASATAAAGSSSATTTGSGGAAATGSGASGAAATGSKTGSTTASTGSSSGKPSGAVPSANMMVPSFLLASFTFVVAGALGVLV